MYHQDFPCKYSKFCFAHHGLHNSFSLIFIYKINEVIGSNNLFYSLFGRGEKLYVTKDRRIKSKWRKWLCWAIILALLIGAVIIGILSASK